MVPGSPSDSCGPLVDSAEMGKSWVPTIPKFQVDSANRSKDPMHLPLGELYGDFFIRTEIGRGAFGVVYLAEQLSLKRTVAIKVTDITRDTGCGVEGQTMAQLEHPSIVRVFSQLVDDVNQRRLLCMQYVSGINLRTLINRTKSRYGDNWNGTQLLSILDEGIEQEDVVLGETSLADRELLEGATKLAAACWIGAQAAFALAHAHQAGYIHHDVKPENTIINRFGRPMLVDFNLATESQTVDCRVKGGTIPYMSPESLNDFYALSQNADQSANACDADVYALGVMIWELALGEIPFADIGPEAFGDAEEFRELIESRKAIPASARINPRLAHSLNRAFHFDAEQRFRSAQEFGNSLLGVAQQDLAINSRSDKSWLARAVVRHPAICFLVAAFLPHIVASGFQIAYNQAEIVSRLTPQANELFKLLLVSVNPIAYGICALFVVQYLFAIIKPWRQFIQGEDVEASQIDLARENLMRFPRRVAIIGAFGWLGGVIGFPGIIYLLTARFSLDIWLHFICSFAISGAIAITFSYALSLAVAVYGIYPTLFARPSRFVEESKRQLEPIRARWSTLAMCAGSIPLTAAILVVVNFHAAELLPSADNKYQEIAFKGLVVGLILASAFGFEFMRRVGKSIVRVIDVCVSNVQS